MKIKDAKYLILIQWGSGLCHLYNQAGFGTRDAAITTANILARQSHHKKHRKGNAPTFIVVERAAWVSAEPKPNKTKEERKKKGEPDIKLCYFENCILPLGHTGGHFLNSEEPQK